MNSLLPTSTPTIYSESSDTILCTNALSHIWKMDSTRTSTSWRVVFYVTGMMTYAVSFLWRIVGFVKDLFMLLGALCVCGDVSLRGEAVVGSFCEILSACVGIICPPVAYKVDEWLHRDGDLAKCSVLTYLNHMPDGTPTLWCRFSSIPDKND